ncbi:MAG: HAD family hydrolase [Acetobacteraceae bacterium]
MAAPPPSVAVFDIGNVLIRWDPRNLYRKLFDGDAQRMEWFLANVCTDLWNLEQDRGRSFADATAECIARFPDWETEIRAYDERWVETLGGAIAENVTLLARLDRAGVPLYAITNYSVEKFALTRTLFPFLEAFRGIVVSGAERIVKPDPRIYRLLCERHALDPIACLFIDDSPANVAAARALGMAAIQYASGLDLARALQRLGLPA